MTDRGRLERLEREGAKDRNEIADDLTAVRARAEAWRHRTKPWLIGAAAAAVAGASALIVSRLRSQEKGGVARRAAAKTARRLGRYRPRPIPVTILFALLRTPAVRRAIVAGAGRLVSGYRPAGDAEEKPEPNALGPADAPSSEELRHPGPTESPRRPEERKERAAEAAEERKDPAPQGKIRLMTTLFREAFTNFNRDEALTRGAALAYSTLLSLAPLLVVVIAVAGLVFGADAVRAQIMDQVGQLVGADAAHTIAALMEKARNPSSSVPAAIAGVGTLLLGAGGVFGYLHDMLNKIWKVPPSKTVGIWHAVKSRFLSLAMVLGTGFLLLVSLVVSAALSAIGKTLGDDVGLVLNVLHQIVSWAVIGVMFALIFRYLPDTRVTWRDVWIGAGITSLLFVLGQFLIGLYLGRGAVASVYAGAGSLVIVLLWTYYSGLILFYGAELTQVFARRWGSKRVASGERRLEPGFSAPEP